MDTNFSSGSLTGCVLFIPAAGLYRGKTCRAIRPSRADQPHQGLPAAEQSPRPARQRRRRGVACRYPLTHPASTLVRQPDRWRSRLPRRGRSSARAANPGPPGSHLKDLAVACRTRPKPGSPPTSARVRPSDTPLDTVSADQSPCGHPAAAGRATDMADLSTVRSAGHPQFR
jgi:hypothetical protein